MIYRDIALVGITSDTDPDGLVVWHEGETTAVVERIHDPKQRSISVTSYVAEQLGNMYGDDLNQDIWPIKTTRKES